MKSILYIIIGLFFTISANGQTLVQKHFNKGYNYLLLDKEIALESFNKVIAADSLYAPAYYYKGLINYKKGQYAECINIFNKALALDSTLDIIHMYKGFAYKQLENDSLAIENFSKYIGRNPNAGGLEYTVRGKSKLANGDTKGALDDFSTAANEQPTEQNHYYRFLVLFENKKYSEAIKEINTTINFNSDFYGYYLHKGNTLFKLGKFKEAINTYSSAIKYNEAIADSYYLRGVTFDTISMYNNAINDFTLAIKLNSADGTFYSKRGNSKYANGNKSGACLDWTIAGKLGYYEDFERIKALCEN